MSGQDDSYQVNLQQLDDAVSQMAKFGEEVDQWLGEVDRIVSDLHLDWTSAAADAQRSAHDRWSAGVVEMRANLDELREVARLAHENYTDAIRKNVGMWP